MTFASKIPLLRNYYFLLDKLREHRSQLDENKKLFNELSQQTAELKHRLSKLEEQPYSGEKSTTPTLLSPTDIHSLRCQHATAHGVSHEIHHEDHINNFITVHTKFLANPAGAIEYYFSTGHESAQKLAAIKHDIMQTGKQSLLEFASGYGCVSRHLIKQNPEFDLTACDIHPEAVRFVNDTLSIPCIGSVTDPDEFDPPKRYRMVFALSFFSHMPRRTWGKWLAALYRAVEPGGVLVFTTHGFISQRKMMAHAVIDQTGFWFNENSEQSDLDTADYGTTITTPEFVRTEIARLTDAKELRFYEGFWWAHQDAWAIEKSIA